VLEYYLADWRTSAEVTGHLPIPEHLPRKLLSWTSAPWLKVGFRVVGLEFKVTDMVIGVKIRIIRVRVRVGVEIMLVYGVGVW